MSRRKDVYKDLYLVFCKVYSTNPEKAPTEKQDVLLNGICDYIENNLSLRRKRKDSKETWDADIDIEPSK